MWSNIPVTKIMFTGEDIPLVTENDLFRTVLEILNRKKLGVVCVTDSQGKLTGIMTDGDVRRIILKTQDPLPKLFVKSVRELMTPNPIAVRDNVSLGHSLKLMNERLIWVLPVVDEEGVCLGLLHMQFVLREYLEGTKA